MAPPNSTKDVFLYWPNIIGFLRIVLAAAACLLMREHPLACTIVYVTSCLLDAVDGTVARAFNQCSLFGAVLDMVTDRSTTACLLIFLATVYPSWMAMFQFLAALDLCSHYMHMYASMITGASSHKSIEKTANPVLRLYYHNRVVLFLVCAGNELQFILLYALHFVQPGSPLAGWLTTLMYLVLPVCVLKQVLNGVQMYHASLKLARVDIETAKKAAKSS